MLLKFALDAAGGVAVYLASNSTVQNWFLTSASTVWKSITGVSLSNDIFKEQPIFLDEPHFTQICDAIKKFKPQESGEQIIIGQYQLEGIFKKLDPTSTNNRFIISSDSSKPSYRTYSLLSLIFEQTKDFITNSQTTPLERDRYVTEMRKLLNALKFTDLYKAELTDEDIKNIREIHKLRDHEIVRLSEDQRGSFIPTDASLLNDQTRQLDGDRFYRVFSSISSLDFRHKTMPLVQGNHVSSYNRPPLKDYISTLHPDTINNQYANGSLLSGFLGYLEMFLNGGKTTEQAQNVVELLKPIILFLVEKGSYVKREDIDLCKSINDKLSKYTEVRPPLSISLEKAAAKSSKRSSAHHDDEKQVDNSDLNAVLGAVSSSNSAQNYSASASAVIPQGQQQPPQVVQQQASSSQVVKLEKKEKGNGKGGNGKD